MKFYNTYSKTEENFDPGKKEILMYNCGPTVYSFATIGNFATFLTNDFLKRYLEFKGYQVKQIMNITDVGHLTSDADDGEDKIIKKAREEGKTPEEIARFFEKQFFLDLKKLNFSLANKYPRATDHVQEMIVIIKELINKGYAYEKDGTVYYDISKFEDYGNLSGNTPEKLEEEVREAVVKDSNKKSPHDFVLWVKAPEKHLMKWDSPWSKGYPGWHLECSAMAKKYLGPTIDIHTGGEDNIFPHHEAEIAQSEAANGTKFVNLWLHRRHILVDGTKMSKSKGTIYTISDLEKLGYDPLVYRFFIFGTHYRSKAHFSFANLDNVKKGLQRVIDFIGRLKRIENTAGTNLEAMALIEQAEDNFDKALANDLNTPEALAVIYDFISKTNQFIDQGKINREEAKRSVDLLRKLDQVVGLFFLYLEKSQANIPDKIQILLDKREAARQSKDFDLSDSLREEIEKEGFALKDTASGQEIMRGNTE